MQWQFVTDGEAGGGDRTSIAASEFNVWQFKLERGIIGEKSTSRNKPTRDFVVATFTTNPKRESYDRE